MWQDSKSWHLAASNGFFCFFSCPGIRRCGYASYWQKAESRKQKRGGLYLFQCHCHASFIEKFRIWHKGEEEQLVSLNTSGM